VASTAAERARCLVAGCGYVGAALAAQLRDAGHAVFGLKRRPAGLPDGVTPVEADLADSHSLAVALDRIDGSLDIVVYAAAADRGDDDAYRRAYVDGLLNVVDALHARAAKPAAVLFTSSTAVYAQDDGSWVDESTPTEPRDFRGLRMLEAEAVLATSSLPAASLRLGGIYGPGRTRLVESVRSGRATIRAGPPRFGNRIHRDDAAGALAHLAALALAGRGLEPLYLGVDDEPSDEAAVLRWIASQLGVAEPPVRDAEGAASTRGGDRPGSNKRCSNARLHATGYRFRFPTFRQGYAAAIAPFTSP
jgi:nucleoside-diphosphate-sugar epimerase